MDVNTLMNRGLLDIKPYVSGKPKEEVEEKYMVKEPVKMNSNENPIGVSPVALSYASEILPQANIYPEGSNKKLREEIARLFTLSPDNVIVGSGADEIIYYSAMSFTNDNDEVIIPRITFPIYEIAFKMMRAKIVTSRMDGYIIDLDDIVNQITEKTKIIALCNPNNPTGHALNKKKMSWFVKKVPDNIIIIMDEAYMEFADREVFPDTIAMYKDGYKNIFIIKTLSKAFGLAGFRVGYGIGHADFIRLMNRIKLPFNISLVSQHAAIGALMDNEFLNKTIENTKEGRKMIYNAMDTLGLSYVPSSTNFILIDTGQDGDFITEELMKRRVIVRSGKNYGMHTSIRVTIGTREQNSEFIKALGNIMK